MTRLATEAAITTAATAAAKITVQQQQQQLLQQISIGLGAAVAPAAVITILYTHTCTGRHIRDPRCNGFVALFCLSSDGNALSQGMEILKDNNSGNNNDNSDINNTSCVYIKRSTRPPGSAVLG